MAFSFWVKKPYVTDGQTDIRTDKTHNAAHYNGRTTTSYHGSIISWDGMQWLTYSSRRRCTSALRCSRRRRRRRAACEGRVPRWRSTRSWQS